MTAAIVAGIVILLGIILFVVVWMRRQSPSRDLEHGLRNFQRGLDALDPAKSPPHLRPRPGAPIVPTGPSRVRPQIDEPTKEEPDDGS